MIPSLLIFLVSAASVAAQTKFFGINIAGFDFVVKTDGSFSMQYFNSTPDGAGQMAHFAKDDGMNTFRLPTAWQWLTPTAGGPMDTANFTMYDKLVQSCLATSAHCIIDIHNYARWDGKIIGQGGPTDADFASLWSQIATKYANETNIIFGLMNEPHDMPNITTWATTVQGAVTAIRKAGATSQMILLPGNGYTGAKTFISDGSAAALSKVKDADGTTTKLIFDVHKYLDSDGSGTHTDCVTDDIADAFQPLATYLKTNGRQAMVTETGGGNTPSCVKDVCAMLAFLNANSDVYLGYTSWSAGGFADKYELLETPMFAGGKWTDQQMVTECVVKMHADAVSKMGGSTTASTSSSNTTSPMSPMAPMPAASGSANNTSSSTAKGSAAKGGSTTKATKKRALKPIRVARGVFSQN